MSQKIRNPDYVPILITDPNLIEKQLALLPLWKVNSSDQLSRQFIGKNFRSCLDFVSAVGLEAEKWGHHPDIHIIDSVHVEIVLFTYSAKGLTDVDFELAHAIDAIPCNYSIGWKNEHSEILEQFDDILRTSTQHHQHRSEEKVDFSRPVHRSDLDHSKAISHEDMHSSKLLHSHDFKIHTGHEVIAGHSDIPHSKESSYTQFETENQHSFAHRPTREQEDAAWCDLTEALYQLRHENYDTMITQCLIPMAEDHRIYSGREDDFKHAYAHFQRRLDPSWNVNEPRVITEACQHFVRSYKILARVYLELL